MVSILGCGWLGLPLAKFLIQNNIPVKGSTTQIQKLENLKGVGISPHLLLLNPFPEGKTWDDFLQNEILIINLPPQISSKGNEHHITQINFLLEKINVSLIKKIIYISSTSVYPNINGEVNESSHVIDGNAMVEAERLLFTTNIPISVLRCGGLMGFDRIPGKYFQGKEITNGNVPVNFVHRDDVIGAVHFIILNNIWYEYFNIVSPVHSLRKDIYYKNSKDFGYELPVFNYSSPDHSFKIISSDKIIQAGYKFIFPDPLDFYYENK